MYKQRRHERRIFHEDEDQKKADEKKKEVKRQRTGPLELIGNIYSGGFSQKNYCYCNYDTGTCVGNSNSRCDQQGFDDNNCGYEHITDWGNWCWCKSHHD